MFNIFTYVFDTITHILTFKLNISEILPLDLLSICRYCMYLDISILQGSVAT